MDAMNVRQPIDPSTALSSFPITKEARVNKVASNSSMVTDRGITRASRLSTPDAPKSVLRENAILYERAGTHSLEQRRTGDFNQDNAVRRYKSSDLLKLETDRESVVNLARFLRTTDPPPNNYMSLPDAGQRQIQDKKLPFKMLRRQTSKKCSSSVVKTLQLPDSAVAAKTSQGHWHIAISIPVEYDHHAPNTPSPNQSIKHSKTQSETAVRNGPITVPKPEIGNVRPAAMKRIHMKSQSHDDLRGSIANPRPLSVPLLSEAKARHSSEARYGQNANQEEPRIPIADPVQSSRPFSRDDTSPASDAARPESQRSDARRSEDTSFTVRSLESSTCHTRGQSSISTAPSINYPASPRANWLHKRNTSGSNHILDQSEQSISAHLSHTLLDTRTDDSLRPTSVGSDTSSANLNIAATAHGYGPDMPGTQVVFVRKGTQIPSYRARTARRTPRNSSAEYILSSQSALSYDNSAALPNGVDIGGMASGRQSRRERVKAIRSRDMAKLKAMKKYQQVMASVARQEIPITPISPTSSGQRAEPYRRQNQKRSLSYASIAEETTWQKTLNSLTPIMVAADIEPSIASSDNSIQPTMHTVDLEPSPAPSELCIPVSRFSTQRRYDKEGKMSMRNSPDEAQTPPCSIPSSPASSEGEERSKRNTPDAVQTPPHSVTPSPASSDTETVQSLKPRPRTSNLSYSQRFNVGNRQADFRHQKSMHDESMDVRMKRLETINAVIFRTLNAVIEMGVGFRELRQLLPGESTAGSNDESSRNGHNGYDGEDRDPVGSLIRELRGAVKIGQEELAKYGAAV